MDENRQGSSESGIFPLYRAWLCGSFRLERREGLAYVALDTKEWGGHSSPRTVLKALICAPRRRASRGTLLAQIWPEAEGEQASRDLNVAISRLRKILRPVEGQECFTTEEDSLGFSLAHQSVFWVDADAALSLVDEAKKIEPRSPAALSLLEEGWRYFQRGGFLENDEGEWSANRRAMIERGRYRCQLWLAEAYVEQGYLGQAETILNELLNDDPTDEVVVGHLMRLLHQRGLTHQALVLYKQTSAWFTKEGLELSEATRMLAAQLTRERSIPQHDLHAHFPPAVTQGIMLEETSGLYGESDMSISRRTLISSAIVLPVAVAASQYDLELFDRFSRAISKPSHLDARTLAELQTHTQSFWNHRLQATFSSTDLLSSSRTHFSLLTDLLRGALSPSERRDVCTLGSETAQIIGMLLFDLRAYEHARRYFHLAIRAAQEAESLLLEIVAWGNLSFAWTYDDNPQQALPCIQEAQRLALLRQDIPSMIQAEFAAREAEVFSLLGEQDASLQALHTAEQGAVQTDPAMLIAGIHFDLARWAGYQGACLRRLVPFQKNSGLKTFLPQAEQALQTALLHVPTSQLLRRSTIELDLAEVLLQEENVETATQHALQAILITQRTGSHMMTQRLEVFRQHIDAYNTAYLQTFDAHFALLQPLQKKDKGAL